MFLNFFKREHKPRIAYREQRNGVRRYYIQTYNCYESGCMWSQNSKETEDLKEAERMLKEFCDKEIIKCGII